MPSTPINFIDDLFLDSVGSILRIEPLSFSWLFSLIKSLTPPTEGQWLGWRQALLRQPLEPHLQAPTQLHESWPSLVAPKVGDLHIGGWPGVRYRSLQAKSQMPCGNKCSLSEGNLPVLSTSSARQSIKSLHYDWRQKTWKCDVAKLLGHPI